MVFVHARNETVRTAMVLCEMAKNRNDIEMFQPESSRKLGEALKTVCIAAVCWLSGPYTYIHFMGYAIMIKPLSYCDITF